jgi:ATP-dependent protease HslVU (ClpYQ) peptidase subunit
LEESFWALGSGGSFFDTTEVLKKERNKKRRKVIKNIVHVNAHTGKRARYEEIEEC